MGKRGDAGGEWIFLSNFLTLRVLLEGKIDMARLAAKRKAVERPAEELIPADYDYESLRAAAKTCMACPLYKLGTQTVFGEGSLKAKVIFVGEQPGDQEDL